MEIVVILMLCFLALLTLRIIELEKRLENKKVEVKEETKEQIEQKNRREALGRLMDYNIEKAYESKVK